MILTYLSGYGKINTLLCLQGGLDYDIAKEKGVNEMTVMKLPRTPPENDGIYRDIGKIIIELAEHCQGSVAIRKSGEKEWEILIGEIEGELIGSSTYPYGVICRAWEWYEKQSEYKTEEENKPENE